MSNVIKIDDGSEVFDIVNTRGELLGQFTFIPSDFDLVKRYEETVKAFEEMENEIQTKENPSLEYMKELDDRMGKSIDYLFNAPVAEKFFSITSPFTMLNSGQFFVENVMNAIRGVIEQKRDVKLKAVQNHVQKYTQKYKAGPGGYLAPVN
ncbi:MAG: hypothetical protein ACLSX5_13985 [Lachnospiraceae bacterium]